MGRRTILPPGTFFQGPELQRRIRDLQLDQDARRPSQHATMFGAWDVGEVYRVADLMKATFGRHGLVEASQDDPGLLLGGHFLDDDPEVPGAERRRTFPFQGRSLVEFEAQVAKWRSHR